MDEIVCVKHVGCVADFNHMNATITWASGEVMRSDSGSISLKTTDTDAQVPSGLLANHLASPAVGIVAGGPLSFTWIVPHIQACSRGAQMQSSGRCQAARPWRTAREEATEEAPADSVRVHVHVHVASRHP